MTQIMIEGHTVRLARYRVGEAYFPTQKSAQVIAKILGESVETVEISPDDEWIDGIELPDTTTPCDDAQAILQGGQNTYLQSKYIPSTQQSLEALGRELLKSKAANMQSDGQRISVAGLWPEWAPGKYSVGDICTAQGQVWECFQAYDTAVYPDIYPGSQAWRTFNRPLHGNTPETAMPWASPTNATDIYHAGEYMVWTDHVRYKCITDTNFSPVEYQQAWEKQKGLIV